MSYGSDEDQDDQHVFEITCNKCGSTWPNTDGDSCPRCGITDISYENGGAEEWNDHMRRTGR